MNTKEGILTGSLLVDQDEHVISALLPPLEPEDEKLQWKGLTLRELFLHKEGITLARLELARLEHRGIECRLQNNVRVQLFLSAPRHEHSPSQVHILFMEEEIMEQSAAAHALFRETLASVIAGFAHEVRNPLAAIMSLTEGVLSIPNMEPRALQALYKIPRLIGRVENLLKNTLHYGKPKPPNLQWHQLERLIEEAAESVLLSMRVEGSFRCDRPEHPVPVYTDANHASSILTNLLANALQATQRVDGVSLQVHTQNIPAGFVAVDVIDNGGGIPPPLQERVFEPFFTTKARGTGLGLALARDLSRINNGDVLLLHSSPNGSTFRYLLRIRAPHATRPESRATLTPLAVSPVSTRYTIEP